MDGPIHNRAIDKAYDLGRQEIIESLGIRFLRFTNKEIRVNLYGVLERIEEMVRVLQPPRLT